MGESVTIRAALGVGWRSARANRLPMAVLWATAIASVALYYLVPGCAGAMKSFGDSQIEYGKLASILNRVVTGGVIPGLFMLSIPSIRPRNVWCVFVAQCAWSALMSIPQDVWFSFETRWFGADATLGTALLKMLVDQLGYSVFFVSPLNAVFYACLGAGFSFKDVTPASLKLSYFSNLIMNWIVWIPVVTVVYAFPPELQMTVSGFIGAFWSLLCIRMGAVSQGKTGEGQE